MKKILTTVVIIGSTTVFSAEIMAFPNANKFFKDADKTNIKKSNINRKKINLEGIRSNIIARPVTAIAGVRARSVRVGDRDGDMRIKLQGGNIKIKKEFSVGR